LLEVSATTLACIAYLGVLTSVVAYLLWYYALSKAAASKVAVFSNLQPVATAIAAWAILGEALTWEIAVGGVLVLASPNTGEVTGLLVPPSTSTEP
jgi:drug/metabolite transporter (DMT)-like permease